MSEIGLDWTMDSKLKSNCAITRNFIGTHSSDRVVKYWLWIRQDRKLFRQGVELNTAQQQDFQVKKIKTRQIKCPSCLIYLIKNIKYHSCKRSFKLNLMLYESLKMPVYKCFKLYQNINKSVQARLFHHGQGHSYKQYLSLQYMNTVLRDRSQKSEIGPDSIINYFIFTKI